VENPDGKGHTATCKGICEHFILDEERHLEYLNEIKKEIDKRWKRRKRRKDLRSVSLHS
jgi:hypothetical protein